MNAAAHTIIETPDFRAVADRLLTEAERLALIASVAENPMQGDVMEGTGGARKLRWGYGNKGKSGGVRVIFYYAGDDVPVFMLDIFAKNEKANLSKAERNDLRDILQAIADEYRKGVIDYVRRG